jgi:hypothetical protein
VLKYAYIFWACLYLAVCIKNETDVLGTKPVLLVSDVHLDTSIQNQIGVLYFSSCRWFLLSEVCLETNAYKEECAGALLQYFSNIIERKEMYCIHII